MLKSLQIEKKICLGNPPNQSNQMAFQTLLFDFQVFDYQSVYIEYLKPK